ncbi:MAG: AAA family ATPase [Alphaproteobacteria bacterium]|jgi:putative secretion ATPase (PEP-CTERM system associated)|nr:AAA family ATPase [Alphaproteobacteria bacterium]
MYEKFYGFTARPFQLTPDPEFWFDSVTHRKAMSYLGYGMNQGEGFIVITGEVGAGKSTLVAHLMERIDPEAMTVAQVVTSSLDGEEIVHVVAQAFGLAVEGHDKAGALGAIERFLQDEARAGRRCLLVVDECQNLALEALEELRMLSNFQLGSHPLLQSLLLGQPEFRRTLAHHPGLDQLRQRIIASHHLEALGEDEIEAYVTHRLGHVGWDARPMLDEGLMAALYRASGGIPRRVNQVMNRLLLLGAIEEQEVLTREMLASVVEEMAGDEERGAHTEREEQPGWSRASAVAGDVLGAASGAVPGNRAEAATADAASAASSDEVAALLAERDARTAQLEAAILDLQAAGAGSGDSDQGEVDPALAETIRRLEARLEEQEQSLRHVLTMLIEWLEDDIARKAA